MRYRLDTLALIFIPISTMWCRLLCSCLAWNVQLATCTGTHQKIVFLVASFKKLWGVWIAQIATTSTKILLHVVAIRRNRLKNQQSKRGPGLLLLRQKFLRRKSRMAQPSCEALLIKLTAKRSFLMKYYHIRESISPVWLPKPNRLILFLQIYPLSTQVVANQKETVKE